MCSSRSFIQSDYSNSSYHHKLIVNAMIGNTLFFSWNAKSNRSIVSSKLLIAKHGWDETKPTTSLQPTQLVSQNVQATILIPCHATSWAVGDWWTRRIPRPLPSEALLLSSSEVDINHLFNLSRLICECLIVLHWCFRHEFLIRERGRELIHGLYVTIVISYQSKRRDGWQLLLQITLWWIK